MKRVWALPAAAHENVNKESEVRQNFLYESGKRLVKSILLLLLQIQYNRVYCKCIIHIHVYMCINANVNVCAVSETLHACTHVYTAQMLMCT